MSVIDSQKILTDPDTLYKYITDDLKIPVDA